ncbi:MAG: anthranilate synthase component I [Nitrososphaerota archaeon]|nr:anthranilate synthase component I [Nitrososphaerota archaeon]MDG6927346.1 anthranilate synthase component I [Nitrososphaerota archaeon]MDG6930926.1 anthranilate synthase component I [Nitrososphaerota archaeon]MDG6932226.1 anthranilate synthase component I [Nitrososphaerota archaeon]MDG6935781.1 anthranilate synthase component I [Nitrososphaerota archaeon]
MQEIPMNAYPRPLELFMAVRDKSKCAALLESAEGPQNRARFSIVAWGEADRFSLGQGMKLDEGLFREKLRRVKPHKVPGMFKGGYIGYFSYETVANFEKLKLPADDEGWPQFEFFMPENIAIYDNVNSAVYTTDRGARGVDVKGNPRFSLKNESMNDQEYMNSVKRVKRLIDGGYTFQTVISKSYSYAMEGDAGLIYERLRKINPSPYMYYLKFDDRQVIGSSPETLFRVDSGLVETFPIAGTRPRGPSPEADLDLEKELMASEKERAEHTMLVDLARNDMGKVCVPGTVKVTEFMYVEKYSHVQHMVSRVIGSLRDGYDCIDVLRATFPAGTVTGAPKPISMKIIAQEEGKGRGPYAGAVGYFSAAGNAEFSIAIRSAFISGSTVRVQAGAGIVYDSVPESELQEVKHKLMALKSSMGV